MIVLHDRVVQAEVAEGRAQLAVLQQDTVQMKEQQKLDFDRLCQMDELNTQLQVGACECLLLLHVFVVTENCTCASLACLQRSLPLVCQQKAFACFFLLVLCGSCKWLSANRFWNACKQH